MNVKHTKMRAILLRSIPYMLVLVSIVGPWFFTRGYLFFTDLAWGPHLHPDIQDPSFFVTGILLLLSKIIPSDFVEKIYITALCAGVLWAGTKLGKEGIRLTYTEPRYWIPFISGLFALVNPFVYDRALFGQFGFIGGYLFFLAACAEALRYRRTPTGTHAALLGLWLGLSIMFASHFIFIAGVTIVGIGIEMLATKHISFKTLVRHGACILLVVLAINAVWLYGYVRPHSALHSYVSQTITYADLEAFQTSGDSGGMALRNVVMMSGFWGKDQHRYVDVTAGGNGFGETFVVVALLVLIGAYRLIRSWSTRSISSTFIILGVMALVLAVGIRLPIAKAITVFLFTYVPFYKGLRETQKWVALLVAVYLVFSTVGISYLATLRTVRIHAVALWCSIVAIIILQAPLLVWGADGQMRPTPYPADWYQADVRMHQDGACTGSTIFLPWHLYLGFSWVGNVIANPAHIFFDCPIISSQRAEWKGLDIASVTSSNSEVEAWLAIKGNTDLLTRMSQPIAYIVLAKEVDWRNYGWLEHDSNLILVQDTPTIQVYKVGNHE